MDQKPFLKSTSFSRLPLPIRYKKQRISNENRSPQGNTTPQSLVQARPGIPFAVVSAEVAWQ